MTMQSASRTSAGTAVNANTAMRRIVRSNGNFPDRAAV